MHILLWDSTKRILFYMTPQHQPVPIKIVGTSRFHLALLFAPISHFPVYTSPNVLFSMYDILPVQVLRICCDAGQCITQLRIHRMKPGLSLYLFVLLCYDRC